MKIIIAGETAAFDGVSLALRECRLRGKPPPSTAFRSPLMVIKLPLGHEGSEYVLSFEIGQREDGFYSERTDTHPVLN